LEVFIIVTTGLKRRETREPILRIDTGWLESEMGVSERGRPVRVFKLTETGRNHLTAERSSFERMFAGITRVLAAAQS
jgi:hypothetical protein